MMDTFPPGSRIILTDNQDVMRGWTGEVWKVAPDGLLWVKMDKDLPPNRKMFNNIPDGDPRARVIQLQPYQCGLDPSREAETAPVQVPSVFGTLPDDAIPGQPLPGGELRIVHLAPTPKSLDNSIVIRMNGTQSFHVTMNDTIGVGLDIMPKLVEAIKQTMAYSNRIGDVEVIVKWNPK